MDREQLEKIIRHIAEENAFRLELVEKDYYLTRILNSLNEGLSKDIIFKGGTLLNKVHLNYHRLSEDLDFSYYAGAISRAERSMAITPIRAKMPAFLKALELGSDTPEGEGFNNSKQYVFKIKYPSFITGKDESVKLEVSLRQPPLEKPVENVIKHFYQDPFTGEDLFPRGKILSLSWDEAVAEKLKAATSRKDVVIRDYYDLWHIAEFGFDFHNDKFIKLFKRKVINEGYTGDYRKNFGLSLDKLSSLRRQVDTDLIPVIRSGEIFNLDSVLERFNVIMKNL